MKTKEDYEPEILDIIKTKDWSKIGRSNNKNLYQYVCRHKDTDENCKTIWDHIKTETRDFESEISEIVETKNWDRAKASNDKNLYRYIHHHKDEDKNCRIIWKHISQQSRDYESGISDVIRTKDWDRAKKSNDPNLYMYVRRHKDIDENCKIIWDHINRQRRDLESEVLGIVETKDWDRAKYSNDVSLHNYVGFHKDTDENCRIIWEHIKYCPYTIKDYLLDYFEHRKLENESLRRWFTREINKGNQCCIDIKNLTIAAENFQDPVALETLKLIKNHLENKEGD